MNTPDDIADRLAKLDESLSAGQPTNVADDGFEHISDCIEFIERVRRHTPACVADLVGERPAESLWLDGGAEFPPQIGRFQIRRKIGQGGFGLVFLAHDPEINRDVALKVPRIEALVTVHTRNRFLREAKTAGSLNHPNIAAVYEAGQIGPICYIASAFCAGGSLAELLRNANSINTAASAKGTLALSPTQAAALICGLARAVEHAHGRGVLHRDLKPSNILFDAASPSADDLATCARIVDFGLARTVENDGGTRTGVVLGTPAYMSPEQAAGDVRQSGPGSDVYSLGAVLYELLTGQPPFRKSSDVETVLAVRTEEPVALRRLNAACPKDLEAICLKCLEKSPSARYSTAALLAEDLQRFLDGIPVHARPTPRMTRVWRWCRRHPVAAILAATVALLTIVGPLIAVNQARLYHAAEHAALETQRLLYVSDMNLASQDWEDGNTARVGELLTRHLPQPGQNDLRGFEWYYLWRKWHDANQSTVIVEPESVQALTLSPDGLTLAVGRTDGVISLWNVQDNSKRQELTGHIAGVYSLTFSPDGTILASNGFDGTTLLWDVANGQETHRFPGSWCVRFSPDGQRLAFRSAENDIAVVEMERAAGVFEPESLRPGETHALSHGENGVLVIQNAHEDFIVELAFATDGPQTLASTSGDGTVRLWDVVSGEKQLTYSGHASRTWAVAWSNTTRTIASGDVDGVIRLWNDQGDDLAKLTGHSGTILSLAFSPDDRQLASASADSKVRLWDLSTHQLLTEFTGHAAEAHAVAFSQDGSQLYSGGNDGVVKVWSTDSGGSADVLRHPKSVSSVAFSPDGRTVVSSCRDGQIRHWDTETGALVRERAGHSAGVATVVFAQPSGQQRLVSTGQDFAVDSVSPHDVSPKPAGTLKVWDDAEADPVLSFPAGSGHDLPLPVAAHGDTIVWQNQDNDLVVFNLRSNQEVARLPAEDNVFVLAFSPDGRFLAAGRLQLAVYDFSNNHRQSILAKATSQIDSLAFSADGSILAVGSHERNISLWRLPQGDEDSLPAAPDRILRGHAGAVLSVLFAADHRTLFSASTDRTIRIWDYHTGQQRASLKGHTDVIEALVLSRDGQNLASAGTDNIVRLWRTAPPKMHTPGINKGVRVCRDKPVWNRE